MLRQVYFNRPMAALLGLGFAAGLPSASRMLGSTLQAWLGAFDYNIKVIGLVPLVTLPIALNFVWAPLLDHYRPPLLGRLGKRRGWLLLIQMVMTIAIVVLGWCGPRDAQDALWPLMAAATVVALLVASHDIVADAYRTDVLLDHERGAGAAVFVNGYRLGMLAASGGALYLAAVMPWRYVYMILAALMTIGMIATIVAPHAPGDMDRPTTLADAAVRPVLDFFHRRRWAGLAVLAFIVLFKLPDAMAAAMTMPLLQQELAFDLQQIALVREWLGIAVIILGAFIGGGVTAWLGLRRSLWLFGALQMASNSGFLLLTVTGKHLPTLVGVVIVENFSAGLVASGFIAFLMSQCNRRYSATQYALFTSLMFAANAVFGAVTGFLVEAMGYQSFFMLTIAAGLPGMAVLVWIRDTERSTSIPQEMMQ